MNDQADGDAPQERPPQTDSRETRASVLSGMRESKDPETRQKCQSRFFEQYRPLLYVFFKRKGFQHHDAEELASELVTKLLKTMGAFTYDADRSFRSYLNKSAQNAVNELREKRGNRCEVFGVELDRFAQDELEKRLAEQFDLDLLNEAMDRVRRDVSDRDWQIFVDLTEGRSTPDQLAATFETNRDNVYQIKYRVKGLIAAELRKLDQQGFGEA